MDMVRNVEVTLKGDVRRLQLTPGDRIVCCFRERLPITAINDVKNHLQHVFPRTEVIVLAGIESFAVIPATDDVVKRVVDA